jgi:hypothetical protein
MMVRNLQPSSWNYVFPYITISLASGQWFETDIWERYHRYLPKHSETYDKKEEKAKLVKLSATEALGQEKKEVKDVKKLQQSILEERIARGEGVRLMMDDRPGADQWIFFTQERGGTWANWDNAMWLWIGDHLLLEGLLLIGATGAVVLGVRRWLNRDSSEWAKGMYDKIRENGDERYNDV